MFFDFFLFFVNGTAAQQVAEVPLTVHAIYWAFYIAMGTGLVKIYADLKQERKERVDAAGQHGIDRKGVVSDGGRCRFIRGYQ